MNKEFISYKVTLEGLEKINNVRGYFSALLDRLATCVPDGREFSLVKTKLEEASFFAVKGISVANTLPEEEANNDQAA